MPAETPPMPLEPLVAMPWNALMTPTTVPSSPTNGAVEPIVAIADDALLQVGRRERRRALNGAADGVEQVLAAHAAAALLLELVFLQTGEHDLCEVAVPVVLGRGEGDRVLQSALLQVLRHLRCEQF